jgi:hypothetical protein
MRSLSESHTGLLSIRSLTALTGFIALGLGACSSDDNGGGGGGTSSFVGTVVGGTNHDESGSLTFDIAGTALSPPASLTTMSSVTLTATGTLTLVSPAAGTHALTGTYDPATDLLALSGGGYTFNGLFNGSSQLSGNYTGNNGAGFFVAALSTGSAQAFCGTFTGDDDGTWNFVVNGTVLSGRALNSSGDLLVTLDGTVTSGDVSIVNPVLPTGPPLATGTVTGTSATGTWDTGTQSGTWTGNGC